MLLTSFATSSPLIRPAPLSTPSPLKRKRHPQTNQPPKPPNPSKGCSTVSGRREPEREAEAEGRCGRRHCEFFVRMVDMFRRSTTASASLSAMRRASIVQKAAPLNLGAAVPVLYVLPTESVQSGSRVAGNGLWKALSTSIYPISRALNSGE